MSSYWQRDRETEWQRDRERQRESERDRERQRETERDRKVYKYIDIKIILFETLKKTSGLHWDLLLLTIINVPVALFGGPWIYAVPLRAMAHLSALTVRQKDNSFDVKDQRMTALIVSILIGLSTFISPLLNLIPIAVIYGVFLYMGVTALKGLLLTNR